MMGRARRSSHMNESVLWDILTSIFGYKKWRDRGRQYILGELGSAV